MSEEFTPITFETKEAYQEAIDNVLKERLNRQKEKHARELSELSSKYQDYDSIKQQNEELSQQIATLNDSLAEANNKVAGYDSQIAEKDAQIGKYQMSILKSNICSTLGLAPELANRLAGTTEEELMEDAKNLISIVGKNQRVAPLASSTISNVDDGVTAAFKKLNPNINL